MAKMPAMAARVSGKVIQMSSNTLGLKELALRFDNSPEASAELLVAGHREHFIVGLDGVDRFSPNTLVNLPAACTGQWTGEKIFKLRINLVGGINCYEIRLLFSDRPGKVEIRLSERTGLNEEQFSGIVTNQ